MVLWGFQIQGSRSFTGFLKKPPDMSRHSGDQNFGPKIRRNKILFLAHIDDLQYSYNIFSLYCAKPEFKHSPIPVKQRRHDFDRISVEEKLILRKQRMTFEWALNEL